MVERIRNWLRKPRRRGHLCDLGQLVRSPQPVNDVQTLVPIYRQYSCFGIKCREAAHEKRTSYHFVTV
jgi:hypothetical protein